MIKHKLGRFAAGILSAAILTSAVPFIGSVTDTDESMVFAEEATILYSNDFEDGDVGKFVPRKNEDDSVTLTAENGPDAYKGSGYLSCTERKKSWHGITLPAEGLMEAGEEYMVSAAVKSQWYSDICLSIQYDDTSGTTHYANVQKVTCQGGDWIEMDKVKFSFPKGSANCSVYFEGSGETPLFLDGFTLSTVPVAELENIASLKDLYSEYFRFGTAATDSELASKSAQALIKKHFNSLTPGNELKPEAVLDQKACQEKGDNVDPQIKIDAARGILDFCRDNNIPVRGHTLVWHSQTPGWFFKEDFKDDGDFVSKEVMIQRMENYIKNVMAALAEEYPTVNFYAWDVVNEAWLDDGKPRQPGTYDENRNTSGWVKVFGDNSFIEYAFTFARKYAPKGCKLYYNDFNEYMPQKTEAIVNMANELKEKGLIDGIGMQSHLDVRSGSDAFPSVSVYEKAMKKFCETGLDVQVTELDVTVNSNDEAGFKAQAEYYKAILDLCKKYSDSISAVVLWGTTDDKSWRSSKYPLIFNGDFTAKPSYYSITEDMTMPDTIPTETTLPTQTPTEETTAPTETATDTTTVEATTSEVTTVTAETTTEITTATGEISTETTASTSEEVKAAKYGDVDLNGMVELADVTKLSKYLLNSAAFPLDSDTALKNADVTHDGIVNALDLSKLLEFNIGKIIESEL